MVGVVEFEAATMTHRARFLLADKALPS